MFKEARIVKYEDVFLGDNENKIKKVYEQINNKLENNGLINKKIDLLKKTDEKKVNKFLRKIDLLYEQGANRLKQI